MSGLMRMACVAVAALVLSGSAASGAAVRMKDGRVFYGEILKQTRTTLVIRTMVSNIPTELTLRMREVERIEEDAEAPAPPSRPEPSREPERDPTPADRRAAPEEDASEAPDGAEAAPAGETLYLEIPIEGVFGEDVHAEGVSQALRFAERRGIEHVVFRLNSPGGYLFAADQIVDAMQEYDDALTYHAVVRSAISASIFVTTACDTIHLLPGASIGGAVAYTKDNSTGAVEVDAKMNSIIAGTLASWAEARGHPAPLVKAMVVMEAEAFAWTDEEGRLRVSETWPSEAGGEVTRIDRDDTVLTLTAEESVKYGLAGMLEGDVVALGAALDLPGWRKFNDYGAAAMRRAQRDAERRPSPVDLVKRQNAVVAYIETASLAAEAKDPRNQTLFHYNDGMLTPESKRAWVKQTDEALAEWEKVEAGLKEYVSIKRQLEALEIESGTDMLNLRDYAERVAEAKKRLREERNRQYIDGV